jgi:beta-fructofuranosidase
MTLRDLVPAVQARVRPRVHFTADDGWINDPYGVVWIEDRYHLFYQAIPGRVTWAPNCHWGHAESVDLIHWTEQPLALTPQEFELGCWSGTVVFDDPERPTILYTRISGSDWAKGKIALAHGDRSLRTWTTGRDDVVIDGPPPGVSTFRDPLVFRHGDSWIMVTAAGLSDGSGAVLQYRSPDLRNWSYDGVLCSRLSIREDDVWTGAVWECPQLFPLGEQWVLLVSVWDDDELYYTAAAVGEYDGRRFVPRSWQRLTYGDCAYAVSTFRDREGRQCVMSWLREEPRNNPALTERAGAHSMAAVLTLTDGVVSLAPHPNLVAHRQPLTPAMGDGEYLVVSEVDTVDLTVPPAARRIRISEGADRAVLEIDRSAATVRVERAGFSTGQLPLPALSPVRILLDSDLLEIFTASSYGAFRIAPASNPRATDVAIHGARPDEIELRAW